jgi:DNA-binding winged helix-turn-helix (wHTH) protein
MAGGVHFSVREFDLLHAFAVCAGHVLSRARVYEHVWGKAIPDPHDRAIDVYVGRVRVKLAQASPGWVYIHTHFGHGYRFEPEPARSSRKDGPPAACVRTAVPPGSLASNDAAGDHHEAAQRKSSSR